MWPPLRQWAALNPLLRHALAAAVAILLVDRCPWPLSNAAILTLAGLALAFGTLVALQRLRLPWELPVAFAFAALHGARLADTRDHPLRAQLDSSRSVPAEVIAAVRPAPAPDAAEPGASRGVIISAASLRLPDQGWEFNGPVALRGWMPAAMPSPVPGDYRIQGRVRIPRGPTNPGQFDTAAHTVRRGFVADLEVQRIDLIRRHSFPIRAGLLAAAERCRAWISRQLATGVEAETEAVAVIRAMALGATDETSPEMERPFRTSGTLHVFAVSGLHVGLIGLVGWFLLKLLHVRKTTALWLLLPGVFAYAFVTGWRPSAARAAIMIALMLSAALFDRQPRLQNSLGAAALVLLAWNTHHLFMPGFQLSFAVLWAIALLATPLSERLRPLTQIDPFLPPTLAGRRERAGAWLRRWLASSVCASVAAWFGSVPLMVWHFSLLTPVSILANCALVPCAFCLLAVSFASVLASATHLTLLQLALNHFNVWLAKLAMGCAALFSAIPGGHASWNPSTFSGSAPIEICVLHMPFGESAQHLRAGGSDWLLDAGSDASYSRVVQPYFQMRGVNRLDGLFLSHSDVDHVGGARRALRDFHAPLLYLSAVEPGRYEPRFSTLNRLLAENHSGWLRRPVVQGDIVNLATSGSVNVEAAATVLYPSATDRRDKADDRAMVLRLDLDGFRVLWCNDAGFIAEKTLLDRLPPAELHCHVLIRNQHASDLSALAEFLLATGPSIIITSNMPTVPEHRMPKSITEYCEQAGATLFDQDQTGAVTLRIQDGRLEARGFLAGSAEIPSPGIAR